jgi:hypothetical protein
VTYEALQSEGAHQMARIAEFIGVPVTPERIRFALEQSSADRMRELEKKQGHLWSSTKQTRQDKPFVRTAKAGGWKNELSEASIAEIESAWGVLMRELGYELASGVTGNVGTGASPVQSKAFSKLAGDQSFAGTRSK